MSALAKWALFGALLAKLALLLAVYPRNHGSVLLFDSGSYLRPAKALLSVGRFSVSPARPSDPEIVRTPGYPALIAAVFGVAGERMWLLAAVNALLAAGTGVLVYRLAASMSGAAAGTAAAVFYCLEPSSFHYATVVMSEIPFTFCLALALWFARRAVDERSLPAATVCGALLGVATLVRPILTFAILPFALALVVVSLDGRGGPAGLRKGIQRGAACAAAALVFIVPWQLRNRNATGDASISQIKNVNLYFFDAASVVASLSRESVRDTEERFGLREFTYRFGFVDSEAEAFGVRRYAELYPGRSKLSLIDLAHSYRDRARSILLRHPVKALADRARGLWTLLWVPNTVSWAYHYGWFDASGEFTRLWVYPRPFDAMVYLGRAHPWLVLASVALLFPVAAIYLFAGKGLLRSAGEFRFVLLVVLVYLLIASTVPGYPDDRLRVPLIPVLCVFAGIGFARPGGEARAPARRIPSSGGGIPP